MIDITPLTIVLEFLPTLVVTLVYLIVFHDRRNHFIEAFILLMGIKAVTYFIYNIWAADLGQAVQPGFNENMNANDLYWVLLSNFVYHFVYALQEFFTWIMVAFVAALFGQVVLAVKLALQEPLKARFGGQTDGYLGLRDRMSHISFSDVESQPLNPAVVSRAWSESWKDYLIIGLATLLPSVGVYMLPYNLDMTVNSSVSFYAVGIWVFLTWMYRFGYPSSNRIAKGLGIRLGERDIGSEMMRGVLGWFFRLNILISVILIAQEIIVRTQANLLGKMGEYYMLGIVQAAPPILFALILLPMSEGFAQVLYRRSFEAIRNARTKLSSINWKNAVLNLFSAVGTGALATAAFVGAAMGVTLNFAYNFMLHQLFIYPDQVDDTVQDMSMNGMNNASFIPPTMFTLFMIIIPISTMLLLGVLGHYVRRRTRGGLEGFAFFAGLLTSVAVWVLLPGMDYLIGTLVTPASFGGVLFFRLRPLIFIPQASDAPMRLASEFAVAVPMYIATVLFILYYFQFHQQWREEKGEVVGPLLTVHARDVWHSVGMFAFGIVGSILGVLLLSYSIGVFNVAGLVAFVLDEIGSPNGLEFVFAQIVSPFVLIAEHNMIRTLLMLVAGPVFWTLILWLAGANEKERVRSTAIWASLIATFMAGIAAYVWTYVDAAAGILNPTWPFVAELGLRATIMLGLLFAACSIVLLLNLVAHRGSRGWWFPPLLMLFAVEYFVYDDQFTLIALVVLPAIMTAFYRLTYHHTARIMSEGFLVTYVCMSLMGLAVAEVLSTALWVAGLGTVDSLLGGSAVHFLAMTLPHGVVEIPAFLFAAAASLRIARDLAPSIQSRDWESVRSRTWVLLKDMRLWRTYLMVLFFLFIGALIEVNITPLVALLIGP